LRHGINFLDTAWIYGRGHSEQLVGKVVRAAPKGHPIYVATKVPPMNRAWPIVAGTTLSDVYPREHVLDYVDRSRENLGTDCIDLLYFHGWLDDWAALREWQDTVHELKAKGWVQGIGVSVNTWEPASVLRTIETGLVDAVQVVYNVFEQRPEDELLPACRRLDVAVVARVPFDEGSLTGNINLNTKFPESDWRASYFVEDNLKTCVPRVERLREELPRDMTMSEFALRFVLQNERIATVIPGMRRERHVVSNSRVSDLPPLDPQLLAIGKRHRWDRETSWWTQ